MNGTFLNNNRLSPQKEVSERYCTFNIYDYTTLVSCFHTVGDFHHERVLFKDQYFLYIVFNILSLILVYRHKSRFELSHLDELRIGSTTLQLHIHANLDTCNWCEPGLNSEKPIGATISTPPTLYKQGKKEINRLKRKYNINKSTT